MQWDITFFSIISLMLKGITSSNLFEGILLMISPLSKNTDLLNVVSSKPPLSSSIF